jgi:hypothetical protein
MTDDETIGLRAISRAMPALDAHFAVLFDQLVGAQNEIRRNHKAYRIRGLEIDDKLKPTWLFNRNDRACPPQYLDELSTQ